MCGIFGIDGSPEAANYAYLGLYSLQHRGQESCGIVTAGSGAMPVARGMGEVADIFDEATLDDLEGTRAIGHTRYSTAGSSALENAQPITVRTSMGEIAIVHNGNLTNAGKLRAELEATGAIFQTSSDTEVILHLMARDPQPRVVDSLIAALGQVEGAYSILLVTDRTLIAARDPFGFRPLILGRMDDAEGAHCFASESVAFDLLEAKTVREVEPGEVVVIRDGEVESHRPPHTAPASRCLFELVYFSRPDSQVFGNAVSQARLAMGAQLAREAPAIAEVVIPIPDSGLFAALGYARESGVPLEFGLIRNHYVGRTFIEPQQSIRHFGVKVKLNPVRDLIQGKRVVLVDDSIVRGTTSPKIVKMVRDAGAAEVHLRISCPPTRWPCYYGIDMPTREELIASNQSVDEIADWVGADSLAYLSLDGMRQSVSGNAESYCTACWTGEYRAPLADVEAAQAEMFAEAES